MRIRWRGLELPSSAVASPDNTTTYGKFTAEPFERGFGVTVGNSLRRILLSSLEGSAITQAKFQGVQHEFTSIPGVVEDVTDIVLNIKSLVVKNHSVEPRKIRIERNRKGLVTGADIITDDQVEVVNKDFVIATMTEDVPLNIEFTVENGRGFLPATEHYQRNPEVGVIPVDAIFAPVTRVRYKIEETRVGQRTTTTSWCSRSGPTARPPLRWLSLRRRRFCASTSIHSSPTASRGPRCLPIVVASPGWERKRATSRSISISRTSWGGASRS